MDPDLTRVTVVGTSCSGKTTLARRLAELLGSTHVELDAIHWKPNWEESEPGDFRARTTEALAVERWVTDGNYRVVRDIVWGRATAVVWLNLPFGIVFGRALHRTFRRLVTREELYSGNRESLRGALGWEGIPIWVLRTFRRNRRRFAAVASSCAWPHLDFIELRDPAQAEAFLDRVRAGRPAPGAG